MSMRTIDSPLYMQEFRCIGPACEDTCCAGWRIDIDRTTYTRYEQLQHPDLDHLAEQLEPNEQSDREETYGRMRMKEDMSCPQLREDKLCRIQAAMGESLLSAVCATFPRITNDVYGKYEMSASLACPEAARMILLNPDGIRIASYEADAGARYVIQRQRPANEADAADMRLWQELRTITMNALRTADLRLDERILFVAELYQNVQALAEQHDSASIASVLESAKEALSSGGTHHYPAAASPPLSYRMRLLRKLLELRIMMGIPNKRYLQCLIDTFSGLDYTGTELKKESVYHYEEAFAAYYTPLMAQHGYLLENYLVHTCYQQLLPPKNLSKLTDAWTTLVLQYALIEFQLIGMAAHYKANFRLEDAVRLIQSFSKSMEHSPLCLKKMRTVLKETGLAPMDQIALLIGWKADPMNCSAGSPPPLTVM